APKLDADSELIEYMREWRRRTAHEQGVPAFVVMHDTTLEELCRKQPKSVPELMSVSGIGIKKSQTYGLKIIEALNKFRAGARPEGRHSDCSFIKDKPQARS